MWKIFLFPFVLFSFAFSAIDECKTDVYYANGILTAKKDAIFIAYEVLKPAIQELYGTEAEMKKHIGEVGYSYNQTNGFIFDGIETYAQKLNIQGFIDAWALLKGYITSHVEDYLTHYNKYVARIKDGHRVLVVAHSQGNLFTNEIYKRLGQESKNGWMQDYFGAVSVASPMKADITQDTERITWDNDLVGKYIAHNGTSDPDEVPNPVRTLEEKPYLMTNPNFDCLQKVDPYVKKEDLGKLVCNTYEALEVSSSIIGNMDPYFNVHAFTFYMGEPLAEDAKGTCTGIFFKTCEKVRRQFHDPFDMNNTLQTNKAKDLIVGAIDRKLKQLKKVPSQWKPKNLGCLCKDKYAEMTHIYDSALMDIRLEDEKVKDFAEGVDGKIYQVGGKYVRARCGAEVLIDVLDSEVCYRLEDELTVPYGTINGLNEEPKTKDGVVEIFLTWTKPELDYDLIVEWDAGEVDVKDTGCPMEHFHIKSEMKIYPGTYRVSIVPKDPTDEGWEDPDLYPFTIDLITRTPGASDKMHFVVKSQSDIRLGHVSDIKVFRVDDDDDDDETDDDDDGSGGSGGSDGSSSPAFIISPEPAPECPPVQYTPSPVPPKPIYFPGGRSGGWGYGSGGSIGGGGSGSGGGQVYPVQESPECVGDTDCLPVPTDSNGGSSPEDAAGLSVPSFPEVGGRPLPDEDEDDNCTGNMSCGCIPCEYEIIPCLKQIYFGPLRDANFSIYSLDGYASKESLFDGKTSNGKTLYDAGEIDVPQVFLNTLEDDKLYVIEAVGGEDIDRNDDFIVDANATKNLGKVYAIASGKDIKYTGFKINILTTVTFELLKQSIEEGDTQEEIEAKITEIASRLLCSKVYPNQADSNITNVDLLAWLPTIDKELLLQSYAPLEEMVREIYAGENIYDEAYKYVFYQPKEANTTNGELPFGVPVIDDSRTPIIRSFIKNISEDAQGGTLVGKIEILRGSEDIYFGELVGKGSEAFEVNNEGEIRLREGVTLDYETKWLYVLQIKAFNKNGGSGSVAVYISVKNILDAPEYIKFEGGSVDENITGGTKVGQIFFDQGASPIIEILMNGTSKDLFAIDNNGTIRLAPGATLDYEEKYSYGFVVVANNSYGSSMPVMLYINVRDIADTPQISNYTGGYVHEDASAGTFVGQVEFNGGGSVIENIYLSGEGSENFTVDINGTIRVSDTAALDYETYVLYRPTVAATNSYGSATRRIFVSVVDSKDVPSFTSFSGGNVKENSPVGTVVAQVLFDPGSMPIDSIVMSGEGSEEFKILKNGTIVVLKDTLNYEEKNHYVVKVTASNALGSSAEVTVHLFVDDVSEQAVMLEDFVVNDLEENLPGGTVIGKITLLSKGSSPVEFFEISGEGADKFSVDIEGNVRLERILDFEQQEIYNLKIKAKNGAGFGNEVNFIVRLSNIAEYVPVLYTFKGFVEDNASAGTPIGNVVFAVKGDTPISMRLEGEGKENFTIDNSGTIRVSNTADLDESVQKVYTLSLLSSNEAGEGKPVDVLITLTYDKTIPYKPSGLKLLDIGHNSLTLGWVDNAQNERGFNLYRDGVEQVSLDANTTSYRIIGLAEESTYFFTLKSFNDRGESQGLSIVGITDIDRSEYLKAVLSQKCGISESTFDVNFNVDTGYYNGSISCAYQSLTSEELLDFRALKEVKYDLQLYNNQLTDLDGLINLKRVGRYFYLHNNKLTNVDGLSKLESVGSYFRLDGNQLTNVNGLSSLTSAGSYFYLNNNQLTNLNGLSSLVSVSNNFNVEGNQLTNLDGLSNLRSLGGSLALRNNPTLIDISGVSNVQGNSAKLLYINPGQYMVKAGEGSNFCSTTWDLRDPSGNIADDMTKVCDSQDPYTPSDLDKFRDLLGEKCNISSSAFYSNFNSETGYYNGSISCAYQSLTSAELQNFKMLKEVKNDLHLYNNQLTDLDGLSSLQRVGRSFHLANNKLANVNGLKNLTSVDSYFYLQNNQLTTLNGLSSLTSVGGNLNIEENQLTKLDGLSTLTSLGGYLALRGNTNLTDISGVSNTQGKNAKMLYINPGQYTAKAGEGSNFCSTTWDLRDPSGNIADDMTQVCDMNNTELTDEDRLRNILGEKCNISSSSFYSNFNADTGYYNGSISCAYQSLTSEELLNFKLVKEVKYDLHLYNNQLTNLDGLSNLQRVGRSFHLSNNQLANVDGLSALESVGGYFYLQNNQLKNINGLNVLVNVGSHLNVEGNQLTNLDGLSTLVSLGGDLALRGNIELTDISGVSNIQSSNGKLLYITPGQYTTKVNETSNFCSTIWDLRDPSGNISDDMTQVCESQNPYAPSDLEKFRDLLGEKCNISSSAFYTNFNSDTGYYNGTISCAYQSLTSEELLNFKVLTEVRYDLSLYHNQLSNLEGLSNLKKVGRHFYLFNNQLINLDGLNKLESVGSLFRLENNQLTNVNGLSSLTRVGNDFNVESNQLTNLDGLTNLTSLGGSLALRGNSALTDISGVSNIEGNNGQILYINQNQYEVKANENLKFCSIAWNMYDPSGDITDDMSLVCDASAGLTDVQQLRAVMEKKCSISFSQFANNFDEDAGVYSGSVDCSHKKMNNDELIKFTLLNQITGSFSINDNNLTQLDGLSSLTSIGGYFYLQNNKIEDISGLNGLISVDGNFDISNNSILDVDMLSNLTTISGEVKIYLNNNLSDIYGLSNIVGLDGKKIYIVTPEKPGSNIDYNFTIPCCTTP